jgi:hypothetical protein
VLEAVSDADYRYGHACVCVSGCEQYAVTLASESGKVYVPIGYWDMLTPQDNDHAHRRAETRYGDRKDGDVWKNVLTVLEYKVWYPLRCLPLFDLRWCRQSKLRAREDG